MWNAEVLIKNIAKRWKARGFLARSNCVFQLSRRPVFFLSQSSSTSRLPIFLYNCSISSSFFFSSTSCLPENNMAKPSCAIFFHLLIWVGWIECLDAICAIVSTSFIASIATCDLNSGECCLFIVFCITFVS